MLGDEKGARPPLLPRTALGMAVLLLFTSLGAGFSGAIFYALYEFRQDESDKFIEQVTSGDGGFEESFNNALDQIDKKTEDSLDSIDAALEPLQALNLTSERLTSLLDEIDESVFFVSTLDEAGRASVGSAFVIFSDGQNSFMVTSYNTIRAATRSPGPPVTIRASNGEELPAKIESADPGRDLALISVARGGLPRLEWDDSTPQIGQRIFVASGLGANGSQLVAGVITDVSSSGIQHDAFVGSAFQGGPLLNGDLEVIGVASRAYAPLNFDPGGIFFGPLIQSVCDSVAQCP